MATAAVVDHRRNLYNLLAELEANLESLATGAEEIMTWYPQRQVTAALHILVEVAGLDPKDIYSAITVPDVDVDVAPANLALTPAPVSAHHSVHPFHTHLAARGALLPTTASNEILTMAPQLFTRASGAHGIYKPPEAYEALRALFTANKTGGNGPARNVAMLVLEALLFTAGAEEVHRTLARVDHQCFSQQQLEMLHARFGFDLLAYAAAE